MIVTARRVLCVLVALSASLYFISLAGPVPTVSAPIRPVAVSKDVRAYRFIARVTNDGGVTPFKVDEKIRGTFHYDIQGTDRMPGQRECGHDESPRNALAFRLGELEFGAIGTVLATVSAFDHSEHFGVVAYDLSLPAGWGMSRGRPTPAFAVLFQNAPPRRILGGKGLPDRLTLDDFKNTRELRLDFSDGVMFPGGQANRRATVFAAVETLEEIRPAAR